MGLTEKGRLGLPDEQLVDQVEQPRQVTYGLPSKEGGNPIVEVIAGSDHCMAVAKNGELYTWGKGAYGRLGLGFIKGTTDIPNQVVPYRLNDDTFDSKNIISAGAGKLISGVAMQSGSFFMWGKGEHERSKRDDHMEFSCPKMIMD